MSTATNVSVGKPKTSGGVYRAPLGTTLPTDAVTALDAAFKSMGYITDAGLTNGQSYDSTTIKAWGGDIVITTHDGIEDTFQFNMMETLNPEVQKAYYGDDNVSGTLATGMTVNVTNADPGDYSWVFETILRNGAVRRIVVPDARISEKGDVVYVDNECITHPITLTAIPDENGKAHTEYTKSA